MQAITVMVARAFFSGELTLTTVGESPMKDAFPPGLHTRVVNARLKSSIVDISASDWLRPTEKRIRGNTVCLYISGGAPDETATIFRKLSEKAEVTDALVEQPFGVYGTLNDGFEVFHGDISQNWLILKNGDTVIGLFQGMFDRNSLTFNPGWDSNAQKLDTFTDVRELQRRLKAQGVEIMGEADESTTGPASFMVMDPDGNPILFDQHV
jgi:uncharacterized glyoxalase superfamily protein PhnB